MPQLFRQLIFLSLVTLWLSGHSAWTETQRFVLDGNNPCARSLQASQLLGPPFYLQPGPLSEEQINLELNRRFPPFSWGLPDRPQWVIEGHRETLADLDLLLTEVINGTAHRNLALPKSFLNWLGAFYGPLGDFRQNKAYSLRKKVRNLDPQTASDEDMLGLFMDLYQVISGDVYRIQILNGEIAKLRASMPPSFPTFHFFFTLREIDYFDIVGLRASGIFPVGMLTTINGWWDGSESSTWLFPNHDLLHTRRQIEALAKFFVHNTLPQMIALQIEYDTLRTLAKSALSRPNPLDRFAGIGALFDLTHEYIYTVFVPTHGLKWYLRITEASFINFRKRLSDIEKPKITFPEYYKSSDEWSSANEAFRQIDDLLDRHRRAAVDKRQY